MTATIHRSILDEFPCVGLSFKPAPMIEITPLRSGDQVAADLGPTLWRAKYQAINLTEEEAGNARAAYDTLLSLNYFWGYDKVRAYPLAYAVSQFAGLTVGGSPFDGTCTLTTVASDNLTATLATLPIGFTFSRGDYVAFGYDSGRQALHRVSLGGTADGSGVAAVELRPFVRPGWSTGATVSLINPAAKMLIVPDSFDEQLQARSPVFASVSFEALQTLSK